MQYYYRRTRTPSLALPGLLLSLIVAQPAAAQLRRVLPEGTVILVSTRQALESQPRTRTCARGERRPARGRRPGRVDHGAIIGWTAATIGWCV